MSVTVVRFSRPVLLRTERYGDEPFYQTVYGFVVPEREEPINMKQLNDYVGYLAAMSCWANGDDFFTMKIDSGIPVWFDRKGKAHFYPDRWMESIERKCSQKLNLSYETVKLEIDERDLDCMLTDEMLIADEIFYYDLERYMKKAEPHEVIAYEPPF